MLLTQYILGFCQNHPNQIHMLSLYQRKLKFKTNYLSITFIFYKNLALERFSYDFDYPLGFNEV